MDSGVLYDCPADHATKNDPALLWRFKTKSELEAHLIGCHLASRFQDFHVCRYEVAHLFTTVVQRDQHEKVCCFRNRQENPVAFNYRNPGYQEPFRSNGQKAWSNNHGIGWQKAHWKKEEPGWKKQEWDRDQRYARHKKDRFDDWKNHTRREDGRKSETIRNAWNTTVDPESSLNKRRPEGFAEDGANSSDSWKKALNIDQDSASPSKHSETISFMLPDAVIMLEFKRLKELTITASTKVRMDPPVKQPEIKKGTLAYLRNTRLGWEQIRDFKSDPNTAYRVVGELYMEGDNKHVIELHKELLNDGKIKFFYDAECGLYLVVCLSEIPSCQRLITFEDGLINQSIIVLHYPNPPSPESEWVDQGQLETTLEGRVYSLREESMSLKMQLASVERERAMADQIYKLQQQVYSMANKLMQLNKSNNALEEAISALQKESEKVSDAIDAQDQENEGWKTKVSSLTALQTHFSQKWQYMPSTIDFKQTQGYSVHCDFLCHLCKNAIASMLFLPCKHLVMCNMCVKLVTLNGLRKCMCCNTRVEYIGRIKYSPDPNSPI